MPGGGVGDLDMEIQRDKMLSITGRHPLSSNGKRESFPLG